MQPRSPAWRSAQGPVRLRAAEAQRQAQARLQRQQLQSTFLAAVSHDLRTPLAAIVAAASSLQAQHERLPAQEQQRMLASIAGQARFLSSITENTLQLVRLASGPLAPRLEWQSLEENRRQRLWRLRGSPAARQSSPGRSGLPLVRGDATLLAQLLTNCSTTLASTVRVRSG